MWCTCSVLSEVPHGIIPRVREYAADRCDREESVSCPRVAPELKHVESLRAEEQVAHPAPAGNLGPIVGTASIVEQPDVARGTLHTHALESAEREQPWLPPVAEAVARVQFVGASANTATADLTVGRAA